MKARRGLMALAGAIVLASATGACGSSSGSASGGGGLNGAGVTLNVLVGVNNVFPVQQRQWFSQVSNEFQQQTGAKVRFDTFAAPTDELTKIQVSALSGQGPDIYGVGTTFTPTAYATGAFEQLTADDWTKIGGKDRFLPATLGISGPDAGHQVGIPFASRPFVMAYNKDLLAQAGIGRLATTWDGLLQQAKQLTSNGVYGLAIGYADGFDPWKFVWAMSIQSGDPIIEGRTVKLTDPSVVKAYQTYLGWLATDKVVDPAAVGWKNPQAVAAFGAGKAAFLPMVSASSKVTLDKSAVAGKYAYTLMPTVPPGATRLPASGKAATSILSGDNLVVAKYGKHKDLALALVKLLTSQASQDSYYRTFGELPTNAAEAAKLEGDPALAAIVDSASKSVGTPFNGGWSQVQVAMVNVVVQSIPDLSSGKVDDAKLRGLIGDAQNTAQSAVDKAK